MSLGLVARVAAIHLRNETGVFYPVKVLRGDDWSSVDSAHAYHKGRTVALHWPDDLPVEYGLPAENETLASDVRRELLAQVPEFWEAQVEEEPIAVMRRHYRELGDAIARYNKTHP